MIFSYRAIRVAIVSQNYFVLVFNCAISHNYRAICCKMGYCTDVACAKLSTVDTKFKVKLIPRKSSSLSLSYLYSYYINWTDDLSHSCPHRYFTPNYTFAFAFVILKVMNSEIILFRCALIEYPQMWVWPQVPLGGQPPPPATPVPPPPRQLRPPPRALQKEPGGGKGGGEEGGREGGGRVLQLPWGGRASKGS